MLLIFALKVFYIEAESNFMTKFPYNARFDWLKQRASTETRARVDVFKLAFKFLLRNFDKFNQIKLTLGVRQMQSKRVICQQ